MGLKLHKLQISCLRIYSFQLTSRQPLINSHTILHPKIHFKFKETIRERERKEKQLILLQIIIPAHIFDFQLMANETSCICKAHTHWEVFSCRSICLLYIYSALYVRLNRNDDDDDYWSWLRDVNVCKNIMNEWVNFIDQFFEIFFFMRTEWKF